MTATTKRKKLKLLFMAAALLCLAIQAKKTSDSPTSTDLLYLDAWPSYEREAADNLSRRGL